MHTLTQLWNFDFGCFGLLICIDHSHPSWNERMNKDWLQVGFNPTTGHDLHGIVIPIYIYEKFIPWQQDFVYMSNRGDGFYGFIIAQDDHMNA